MQTMMRRMCSFALLLGFILASAASCTQAGSSAPPVEAPQPKPKNAIDIARSIVGDLLDRKLAGSEAEAQAKLPHRA